MLHNDERVEDEDGAVGVEEERKDVGAIHAQIVVERHKKRRRPVEEENEERKSVRVGQSRFHVEHEDGEEKHVNSLLVLDQRQVLDCEKEDALPIPLCFEWDEQQRNGSNSSDDMGVKTKKGLMCVREEVREDSVVRRWILLY